VLLVITATSGCLLVDASSVELGRRLVDELRGVHAELAPGEGPHCLVAIRFDRDNDGWLDGVLDGLQSWLAASALASCRVQLDGRSYVLERASS
jgi:hypothetical protein